MQFVAAYVKPTSNIYWKATNSYLITVYWNIYIYIDEKTLGKNVVWSCS
jgi:hypothetical protein